MMKRVLKELHYEWLFIVCFIYSIIFAYIGNNVWGWIIGIILACRILLLKNKSTLLLACISLFLVLGHAYCVQKNLRQIEGLDLQHRSINMTLKVNPLDQQLTDSYWQGKGEASLQWNGHKYSFPVQFIKWLSTDETVPTIDTHVIELETTATFDLPDQARNFHTFDYRNYLKSQGIIWSIELENIESYETIHTLSARLETLRARFLSLYHQERDHPWIGLHNKLLWNLDSPIYKESKETLVGLGVVHLFSISGYHIYFIRKHLTYYLRRMGVLVEWTDWVVFIFLIIYAWLIDWPVGVVRVLSMQLLQRLGNYYHGVFSGVDCLAISALGILIFSPYQALSLSFILSYLMTLVVQLKGHLPTVAIPGIQTLELSLACLFVSWPIIIQTSFEWNGMQIVYVIIFGLLFDYIVMPLMSISAIVLVVKPWGWMQVVSVLDQVVRGFMFVANKLEKVSWMKQVLGYLPEWLVIVYIGVGLYFLAYHRMQPRKSYSVMTVAYLLLFLACHYLNPTTRITIIDVGQGDSILYQLPFGQGNWLLDTGGRATFNSINGQSVDENYANKTVIPALKALGVKKLDGVIVSHGDMDHIGNLPALSQAVEIDNLWLSDYTVQSDVWKEMAPQVKRQEVKILELGKVYQHDSRPIQVISAPIDIVKTAESPSNDGSLVVNLMIGDLTYLSLGDVSIRVEQALLEKKYLAKADIIKLGHHGSRTSTSRELFDTLNPQLAVISAGVNNRYGHPHEEVIDLLTETGVAFLATADVGAIQLIYHPWFGYSVKTASDGK